VARGGSSSYGYADALEGRGGDAVSESVGTSEAGGDVLVEDSASASSGADGGRAGGDASSKAFGQTTGGGNVQVSASARGGSGAPGTTPGRAGATLVEARGVSDLGEVTVTATGVYGGGGATDGSGDPVAVLENVASGRTAGKLTLRQKVDALRAAPHPGSDRRVSESILHAANPGGGEISAYAETMARYYEGIHARTTVGASSDTAAATAIGAAMGVGSSEVFSSAQTTGDDHAVVVGLAAGPGNPLDPRNRNAPWSGARGADTDGRRAGTNAASRSEGRAAGESSVSVYDYAIGGKGGRSFLGNQLTGGTADSLALATGRGEPVLARANGSGGASGSTAFNRGGLIFGDFFSPSAAVLPGATSNAIALATGTSLTNARADAVGGIGADFGPFVAPTKGLPPAITAFRVSSGGDAIATATAAGGSGSAVANSVTEAGNAGRMEATSSGWFEGGQALAMAVAGVADGGLPERSPDAAAFTSARLRPTDVAGPPGALTIASGLLGAGFGDGTNQGVFRSESRTSLAFHAAVTSGKSDLFLSFDDPEVLAGGFDSLVIRILDDSQMITEMRFEDEAEATRFLDGSQIDVGDVFAPQVIRFPGPFPIEQLVPELFDLTIALEVSGDHAADTGISTTFRLFQSAAVPEASAFGSLSAALLLIAMRRRDLGPRRSRVERCSSPAL
jgi:hypothetical protein